MAIFRVAFATHEKHLKERKPFDKVEKLTQRRGNHKLKGNEEITD